MNDYDPSDREAEWQADQDAAKARCEHRHTHPGRCDDCHAPWCYVCRTYHADPERSRGLCIDHLRADLARVTAERNTLAAGIASVLATARVTAHRNALPVSPWIDECDAILDKVRE